MTEAARIIGLTRRTLYNAASGGRLSTVKVNDILHVGKRELLEAPLLQLGDAGKRVHRCHKTMQRWVEAGRLQAFRSSGGRRFVSLNALRRAAQQSAHPAL